MYADERKTEGQVFTPPEIVNLILDSVQYSGKSVLTKTIMEPSFGNGAFLVEIVSRIIHEARSEGKSADEIGDIIDRCVFGIEKDRRLYDEAILKLNELLAAHDVPPLSWTNLICGDTLLKYTDYAGKMDICVGNPPYVRVHNIGGEYRGVVKNFNFAKNTEEAGVDIKYLKRNSALSFSAPDNHLTHNSHMLIIGDNYDALKDVIVYSGIYITIDIVAFVNTSGTKSTFDDLLYDKRLEAVRGILSSPDFHKYCVLVGKDMQGGYVSVSSVLIKNYGTPLTHLPNLSGDVLDTGMTGLLKR